MTPGMPTIIGSSLQLLIGSVDNHPLWKGKKYMPTLQCPQYYRKLVNR